jgi:dipeptidyl aminopeptidase/acylaminoacyl peptidase
MPKNPFASNLDPIGMVVRTQAGSTRPQTPLIFNQEIQFWTSRGFAYLDVNYSGSSGYGRKYRDRLIGQWGYLDVEEAILAAEYVIKQGWLRLRTFLLKGAALGGLTSLDGHE